MPQDIDNPGAVIGVTGEDAEDVLVVRSGELRPAITEPIIIGSAAQEQESALVTLKDAVMNAARDPVNPHPSRLIVGLGLLDKSL